jgi:hypothetical protein
MSTSKVTVRIRPEYRGFPYSYIRAADGGFAYADEIAQGWTAREMSSGGSLTLHFPKYSADWYGRHDLEITPGGTLIFHRHFRRTWQSDDE